MHVAIKDANIIDLIQIDLIEAFFKLDLRVITSDFVDAEIKGKSQRAQLTPFIGNGLEVLSLSAEEIALLYAIRKNRSRLSVADCSVLYLAQKHNAVIITGDKPLRLEAEEKGIEVHGLLWIIDQLVDRKIIESSLATRKLILLQESGSRQPRIEMEIRLKRWNK